MGVPQDRNDAQWSFAVLTEELAVVHPRRVANDFLQDTPFNIIHRLDSFTWSILIKLYFLQHDRVSNYDRTFHVKTDYCSKLHRDDRVHTRGLNVNAEVSRTVRQQSEFPYLQGNKKCQFFCICAKKSKVQTKSQFSFLSWERREEKRGIKN